MCSSRFNAAGKHHLAHSLEHNSNDAMRDNAVPPPQQSNVIARSRLAKSTIPDNNDLRLSRISKQYKLTTPNCPTPKHGSQVADNEFSNKSSYALATGIRSRASASGNDASGYNGSTPLAIDGCIPFLKAVMSLLEAASRSTAMGSETAIRRGPEEESGKERCANPGRDTTAKARTGHIQNDNETLPPITSPSRYHDGSQGIRPYENEILIWEILQVLSDISHQVAYRCTIPAKRSSLEEAGYGPQDETSRNDFRAKGCPSEHDELERSQEFGPGTLSARLKVIFGSIAVYSQAVLKHLIRTGAFNLASNELVQSLQDACNIAETEPRSGPAIPPRSKLQLQMLMQKAEQLWKQWPEGKKLLLTVGKQDYSLVRRLGWGSFGVVFEAHTKDKGVVAIKFEPYNRNRHISLKSELRVYQALNLPCHGYDQNVLGHGHVALVIDRHGPSLDCIHEHWGREFSTKALALVMKLLVGALGDFHKRGLLHRDIKPPNILVPSRWSSTTGLCLVDFGLSVAYVDETGKHNPFRPGVPKEGTPRYTPPEGAVQSRLQDLVMALYTGVSLAKPLPWQGLKAPQGVSKRKIIDQKKRETDVSDLVDGIDPDLARAFKYCLEHTAALPFDQRPEYEKLQDEFDKVVCQSKNGDGQLDDGDKQLSWLKAALAGRQTGPCPRCQAADEACSLAVCIGGQ